jgi:secretion/DNA translocation related CpaE-like protein
MTGRCPLVVTADELLLDEVLRLAAAGGVEMQVAPDVSAARTSWSDVPAVVLGADVLPAATAAGLPRRDGLLVVSRDDPGPAIWRAAVAVGAEQVVSLADGDSLLVQRLADAAEGTSGAAAGMVLCCIGGCGGAGASVLAASLALTAARSLRRCSLLVDLDPYGGGLDLALGGERADGMRWPELGATAGRLSAVSLRAALPSVAGVTVLSTARDHPDEIAAETAGAVLAAGRRAGDVVVVDLPRMPTPAARVALESADRVLLVVPAEVRACAAAASTAGWLGRSTERLELVVRTGPQSRLTPEMIARALDRPLAASTREEPGLLAALDRGEPPIRRARGPLATMCRELLTGAHEHQIRLVA